MSTRNMFHSFSIGIGLTFAACSTASPEYRIAKDHPACPSAPEGNFRPETSPLAEKSEVDTPPDEKRGDGAGMRCGAGMMGGEHSSHGHRRHGGGVQ
jgi:hypothetical protein